ncbi:DUF6624 domain-containing protein [Sphingomonas aerophila]|uniref:Uncharacterized protein n=1 Tax=Sphingomonas aerophila TaxID=1344948 RepID=A0A7W9ESK4_9SPHN|nr:DUF6624 domain-containing protein [Sphingomonas aerophila]MBB5713225.1 hypothetical protein [Sphingomonas aerophila]
MLSASTKVEVEMRSVLKMVAGADGDQLSGKLEDRLKARASREELLRKALVQARGTGSPAGPSCHAATLVARLGAEIESRDAANLRDLTKVVAVSGWPIVDASSGPPWYFPVVQHADRQLAEQYRILLQWRPLAATNRVSPKAYAYLYDRVMLQLRGTQLYGTQFECQGGRYLPSRIEDSDTVDNRRKELGMVPMGKYAEMLPSTC